MQRQDMGADASAGASVVTRHTPDTASLPKANASYLNDLTVKCGIEALAKDVNSSSETALGINRGGSAEATSESACSLNVSLNSKRIAAYITPNSRLMNVPISLAPRRR